MKNLPDEQLDRPPSGVPLPPQASAKRTFSHKMFAWKASTWNSLEPGAAFLATRDLQSLAAPFSGVALTPLPLRLQLSGQLPSRKGLRCASGWERIDQRPVLKLAQETSHPSRWGQGHEEGGPITISYVQITLTVLLTTQTYKGKVRKTTL